MSTIRAFVGHSFLQEDGPLIQAFLKYFNQVKKIDPRFSWDHAESAEPIDVPEKVLRLFSDRTLFVGICTKNERVIKNNLLKKSLWYPRRLFAIENEFQWKASDWLVQEIGLAIGLKLPLVLFMEEGVRTPGGVQGSIEYIEFSRQSPERSFGRFLEMITAIVPPPAPLASITANPKHEDAPQDSVSKIGEMNSAHKQNAPESSWRRSDYERAYFRGIFDDDLDYQKEIDAAYKATEVSKQVDNEASWNAFTNFAKVLLGKGGSLEELRELAQHNSSNARILSYYGRALKQYEKPSEAAKQFELAAVAATNSESDETHFLSEASQLYAKGADWSNSRRLLVAIKMRASKNPTLEPIALHTILELSKLTKSVDEGLAAFERIVDLKPDDITERFNLAYRYSQSEHPDIALKHYLGIPHSQRNGATWNNLGVAYNARDMPARAVDAFRMSEEMGETLAMSNLAGELLEAGFIKEAREICNTALKVDDYHENVVVTLKRLNEIATQEDKLLDDALSQATRKSNFYRDLGSAMIAEDIVSLPSNWQSQECELTVSIVDGEFNATGEFEKNLGALASIFLPGVSRGIPEREKVELSGKIMGRAMIGRSKRHTVGTPPVRRSLIIDDDSVKVLMIVQHDEQRISVIERPNDKSPRYYDLTVR